MRTFYIRCRGTPRAYYARTPRCLFSTNIYARVYVLPGTHQKIFESLSILDSWVCFLAIFHHVFPTPHIYIYIRRALYLYRRTRVHDRKFMLAAADNLPFSLRHTMMDLYAPKMPPSSMPLTSAPEKPFHVWPTHGSHPDRTRPPIKRGEAGAGAGQGLGAWAK